MKKSDLKTGMWVVCKDGDRGMVLLNTENGDIISGDTNWGPLSSYDDDLKYKNSTLPFLNADIVKVIQPSANKYYYHINNDANSEVIWERKKQEPVTINLNMSINADSVRDVERIIEELQEKLKNLKVDINI